MIFKIFIHLFASNDTAKRCFLANAYSEDNKNETV